MNREWTPIDPHFNTEQAKPAVIASSPDESLVRDPRAGLTPAQMVERKLMSLLESTPLTLSRFEAAGPRRPVT